MNLRLGVNRVQLRFECEGSCQVEVSNVLPKKTQDTSLGNFGPKTSDYVQGFMD